MSAGLPAEIVCAVASHLDFLGRVHLSHVCSLWRGALLEDAFLWSHIAVSLRIPKKQGTSTSKLSQLSGLRTRPLLAEDLLHLLTRTGDVRVRIGPLRIPNSEKEGWALARVIVTHLHRITELDLQCASARTSNIVLRVLSGNQDRPAPLLRRFAFANAADDLVNSRIRNPEMNLEQRLAVARLEVVLPDGIFAGGAPKLTTLELENVHLASLEPKYSALASVVRFGVTGAETPQRPASVPVSLGRVMPRLAHLRTSIEANGVQYSLAHSQAIQTLCILCPEWAIQPDQWQTLSTILVHQEVRNVELVSCSDKLLLLEFARDLGGWEHTLASLHFVCNHSERGGMTHAGRLQNMPLAETSSIRISNSNGFIRTFRRMSRRIGDPIGVHLCTGLRTLEVDDVLLPTLNVSAVRTWPHLWRVTVWFQFDLDARIRGGRTPLSLRSALDALTKVLDPNRSPNLRVLEINAYNGEGEASGLLGCVGASSGVDFENQDDAMNVHALPSAGQVQPIPQVLKRCIAARAEGGHNRALPSLKLCDFLLNEDDLHEMRQQFSEIEITTTETPVRPRPSVY